MNRKVISDLISLYSRNTVISEESHNIIDNLSNSNKLHHNPKIFSLYPSDSGVYQFAESAEMLLKNNQNNHSYAVLVFDIDKFSEINRLFGNSLSNELIAHISSVLKNHIKEPHLYCNIGENFAIFLENYTSIDIAMLVIQLSEEISCYYPELNIKPAFGICIADQSDQNISYLYKRAFFAKNTIKGQNQPLLANYTELLFRNRKKVLPSIN